MNFPENILSGIKNRENERVKLILHREIYCNGVDAHGAILLHYAAEFGNLEITQYLVGKNYNLNARNAKGQTPLMKSLEGRHHVVAQYLLGAGADVSGFLHVAVKWSDAKGVKMLLNYGADINELNNFGATPLFYTYFREDIDEESETENIEILRILLSLDASLMTLVASGYFPIMFVLSQGSCEAVRLVLRSKIDFNAKDKFGEKTILHYLAMNRDPGIVDELKPHIDHFDLNVLTEMGGSPLREAVDKGNVRMVEFLLQQGAKVDQLCRDYSSTVLWSAFDNAKVGTPEQYQKCTELLLQYNVDPQATINNPDGGQLTIVDLARMTDGFDKLDFIIAQLAIREKQKLSLTEPTRSKISSHAESKIYLKKCRRFLKKKIAGSVNVFKLLTTSDKKMKKYLKNRKLIKKLLRISYKQPLNSAYKYYFNTLKKRFTNGILSKALKDKASKVICQLFHYQVNESNIVTDKIIAYLNNEDLRELCLM